MHSHPPPVSEVLAAWILAGVILIFAGLFATRDLTATAEIDLLPSSHWAMRLHAVVVVEDHRDEAEDQQRPAPPTPERIAPSTQLVDLVN